MPKDLPLSPKLKKKITQTKKKDGNRSLFKVGGFSSRKAFSYMKGGKSEGMLNRWGVIIAFLLFVILFVWVGIAITKTQILEGQEYAQESEINHFRPLTMYPYRGIIFDRNGEPLTRNTVAKDLYLNIDLYRDEQGFIEDEDIKKLGKQLESVLGKDWEKYINDEKHTYPSISAKIFAMLEETPFINILLIGKNIDNETSLKLTLQKDELKGVFLEDGYQREYTNSYVFSPILGYTGIVFAEDLQRLDYISMNDVIGKTGLEQVYDRELIGQKGLKLVEVDAYGHRLSDNSLVVQPAVSGKNLFLTIDGDAQKFAYDLLEKNVKKYKATSGALIIEDVSNGEILVMASYPSYDNNKFVQGISQKEYEKLLKQKGNPLTNKAISAQVPPGSTFKTLVALSALDAKAINTSTTYVSRSNYTFSNGRPFQEYHNHAYGPLTVIDALMVSSNIYFCETIRKWDMNQLVEYLTKFRVGEPTGIDLPGEMPGRLPSPENKIKLAKTTSPWLAPVWYPEGDACNSVIGQGITLVTPIQAVNWASMIANGGTLNTPHLGKKFVDEQQKEEELSFDPVATNIVDKSAIKVVQEGMRASVAGPRRVIIPLTGAKANVAAKTGTAEFGRKNSKGVYEHTHAWVIGFWPYEDPKYAFVVFLEDGGASNNSASVAREFVDWWESR